MTEQSSYFDTTAIMRFDAVCNTAYNLIFALNPLLTFKVTSSALSINRIRTEITLKEVLVVA